MLIRVDVDGLIAELRKFIEEQHLDFARKRLDNETFPFTVKYLEGYRDAADQIARDVEHRIHLAIVEQQQARGE
jgi:hypothetical protein